MPSKSSKTIAVILQIALGLVLVAILGLLSGLLTGDPEFLKWLNGQWWYSPRHAALATAAVLAAMIAVAIWQYFYTRDDKAPVTSDDLEAAMRKAIEAGYDLARREGRIPAQSVEDKDAEITHLTQELQKLKEEVAARSSEPSEAELEKLLKARDLDGALRLKTQQVQARRTESARLPRDLYELGTIHELRFEWPEALAAFREAWEMGHDPEHGFRYAIFAQKLNRFNEAISAYEKLLTSCANPPHRAGMLNNLAILYRAINRTEEAEEALREAVGIFRELGSANPSIYLPNLAGILNSFGNLYRATERPLDAEGAYREALAICRKLRETNANEYPQLLMTTLSNLVALYGESEQIQMAEDIYLEVLDVYQKLVEEDRELYLPLVATVADNLGNLHLVRKRIRQAEEAHLEALAIRRTLAEHNPDAHLPDVASTLNNLAFLYLSTQRFAQAEATCIEAEGLLGPLWRADPLIYGDRMARVLSMRSFIYSMNEAKRVEACAFARRALDAARTSGVKQSIQRNIDRLCPAPEA